jgi:superfamily I DNA and/or RNA helicase
VRKQIQAIDAERAQLQAKLDQLEQEVINGAKAIFCTLTKNYVGESLKGQQFTAVIVDEISMALPPLIFLAAARASTRVILVGDFKQLPPIVRSKEKIAKERLGKDVFQLADLVTDDLKPVQSVQVLTMLKTQQRMRPEIASVARKLACGPILTDSEKVKTGKSPDWLNILSSSRLLIVDTADLNSWCGREVGSLSRFNFNSATVCIDLAALAAVAIARDDSKKQIGIVTPYAAQRRLLKPLVDAADLGKWVQVGTVHTFQGGEAELIIFDSVLDEPYWSSRLTNPRAKEEVRRDHVAVTRARNS